MTLDAAIESYIQREVDRAAGRPPVYYGVWIPGYGWLKLTNNSEVLVDRRIEVAEAWAALYGAARVLPIDETLTSDQQRDVEKQLLEREQARVAQGWRARLLRWWYAVTQ